MRGLYDGLEEVAFKQTAGGYVFQSNNPWFIGPRRRYFVNEAEKATIADCIRGTLRGIKPFVFAMAVLIPLVLVGGTVWFAFTGTTLDVTETDATGKTTTYSQSFVQDGASGAVTNAEGAVAVEFKISGYPGSDATIIITGRDKSGKPGKPLSMAFGPAGHKLNLADNDGRIVKSAVLVPRTGATSGAVTIFALLLSFGLFVPYLAAIHIYSMARLRPLLAGLPRSNERITFRETSERMVAKISNKLLVVMAVGAGAMLAGNSLNVTMTILSHRPLDTFPIALGAVASVVVIAQLGYLLFLKARAKRNAA
jgi:hypothetical protein